MKNWEDIVKDKLEDYESELPEGSLAEFRALRDGRKAASRKKASSWIWAMSASVAAGLAALLFLRTPSACEPETFQPGRPAVAVERNVLPETPGVVVEPVVSAEPLTQRAAQASGAAKPSFPGAAAPDDLTEPDGQAESDERTGEAYETSPSETVPQIGGSISSPASSPYIPEVTLSKPFKMKLGPAAGAMAGTGLVAALMPGLLNPHHSLNEMEGASQMRDAHASYLEYLKFDYPIVSYNPQEPDPAPTPSKPILTSAEHSSLPLTVGLSTRMPLSEKTFLTAGLEYSIYTSEIAYDYSRAKTQKAHYLGVPVLYNWTLASGKWMNFYIGAGVEGIFGAGSTLNGDNMHQRDGFSLSLTGTGGVQINANQRLGIFVEPRLNWTVLACNQELATYRSNHPWAFTIATGFRINLW